MTMWLEAIVASLVGFALLSSFNDSINHLWLLLLDALFSSVTARLEARHRQMICEEAEYRKRISSLQTQHMFLPPIQRLQHRRPSNHITPIVRLKNERLKQCSELIVNAVSLVLEDNVTPRFSSAIASIHEWNLLTRTRYRHKRLLDWELQLLWSLGVLLRYGMLVPLRSFGLGVSILLMTIITSVLGQLPEWRHKQFLVRILLRGCFYLATYCTPVVRRVHNPHYQPRSGICVANHTSPLDVLLLMCDVHYSLTGQRHNGILGIIQRALSRVSPHVWFERSALQERESLQNILVKHACDHSKPPILLFPEGTCVNNTAVMQFRKGCFEIADVIHPIAIRYDRRYGDPFWDSRSQSMLRHLLNLISSWCIVCDIRYLPAVKRRLGENAIQFAARTNAIIARAAKLEILPWDGNLKRFQPVRDW